MIPWSAALAALLLTAATPQSVPAQSPTIQQQFDAAEAARQAGNGPEALRLLEALESRTRNPRTLALIRVRKGAALIQLGRYAEGAEAIHRGMPGLPGDDATLHSDRFLGILHLGLLAERELDYPEALRQYRLAAAIPVSDSERLLAIRGIIQTQLFGDAEAAVRDADAGLRIVSSFAPENRTLAGQLHTLKGRALLNLGRFEEARRELQAALRLLGNLTLRVDRSDLLARSDLAIAALLAGNRTEARRYLAYTGAGQFANSNFDLSSSSVPARCGPTLAPEDVAVLEFIIAQDGHVEDVKPIYASRQGSVALELARAARSWTFDPADAAAVPALFRSVVRLEVRCSNSDSFGRTTNQDAAPPVTASPALAQALLSRRNASEQALRTELAALDQAPSPDTPAQIAVLLVLGDHQALDHAEHERLMRRALPLASAGGEQPELIAGIALSIAYERSAQGERSRPVGRDFADILAMPEISGSAEASAHVRLAQARALFHQGELDAALAHVREASASPAMSQNAVLVRRANEIAVAVHGARGDVEAARAAYRALGEDGRRCVLEPRSLGVRASSRDYPDGALQWGFEGWAVNEASIRADGQVVASRTVAAYPPFVFGPATTEISQRTRYAPFFVPDGAACVLGGFKVSYRMPDRR